LIPVNGKIFHIIINNSFMYNILFF
jgi:hypothetical protein